MNANEPTKPDETMERKADSPLPSSDLLAELQRFDTLSGIGARLSGFEGGELAIIASNPAALKAAWEKLTGGKLSLEEGKCQRAGIMSAKMPIFSANESSSAMSTGGAQPNATEPKQ